MLNRWGNNGNSDRLYFHGSKITADDDCSHVSKRCLLLGRKAMINLDRIIKTQTLLCQQMSVLSKLWFFQWSCMDVRFEPSVQFSSITQSYLTLCDPMNHSTPGLPVHHQLPEFTQTHAHPVSDAIQPSHPLSSPSPPAPNPSQHQSLFQ